MPDSMAQVKALEAQRFQAMIDEDVAALERLLDAELTWTHANGQCDGKSAVLKKIASGATKYLAINRTDETYRSYGDMCIANGIAEMNVAMNGETRALTNRYTDVWKRSGDAWTMVAWQSTSVRPKTA